MAEKSLDEICVRGGWNLLACAVGEDHVHVICEAPTQVHGEQVRRLIKRWLSQELNARWPLPEGARWWADEGSNRAIHGDAYLRAAIQYVDQQRFL